MQVDPGENGVEETNKREKPSTGKCPLERLKNYWDGLKCLYTKA